MRPFSGPQLFSRSPCRGWPRWAFRPERRCRFRAVGTPISSWAVVGVATTAASTTPNNSSMLGGLRSRIPGGGAAARLRIVIQTPANSPSESGPAIAQWLRPNAPAPIKATRGLHVVRSPEGTFRRCNAGAVRHVNHFFFIEQQRAAGIDGQHRRVGLDHGLRSWSGRRPAHRTAVARPRATFDQPQRLAVDQRCGAAQHGVGAFHGFGGDTGSFTDGYALADVAPAQRSGDAAAITDSLSSSLVGLAPRQHAFGRQQRFQQRGRIHQLDALSSRTAATPPIRARGVLLL